MASPRDATDAASGATGELKDEDELQGNSEFLPAGACHATEAAKDAAQTVIQTALASVRNGATSPDASGVADAARPAADAAAAAASNERRTRNNSPSS